MLQYTVIGGLFYMLGNGTYEIFIKKKNIKTTINHTALGKMSKINIFPQTLIDNKLNCILPSLKIFVSLPLLTLYLMVNMKFSKSSIVVGYLMCIFLIKKNLYNICTKDDINIYKNLMATFQKEVQK